MAASVRMIAACFVALLAAQAVNAREPEAAQATSGCMPWGGRSAIVRVQIGDKGHQLRLRLWGGGLARAQNGKPVLLALSQLSAFPDKSALGDAIWCAAGQKDSDCVPASATVRFSSLTFGNGGVVAGEVLAYSGSGLLRTDRLSFSAVVEKGVPCD